MKVLLALSLLAFLLFVSAAPLPSHPESREFLDFISKYNRVYLPEERALRSRIFERNLAKINSINSNPNYTWTAGINHLADRSTDEMAKLKGYSRTLARSVMTSSSIGPQYVPRLSPSQLPASVDWRDKGVVTKVKNQGGCGSCWAFSTAETMESAVAIASGQLLEFSEQQLIDCAPNPNHCGGTGGCEGSVQEVAMNYSKSAGITTETDYAYTAETGTCQPDKIKPVATIDGYVKLPTNDYDALMTAVATIGPIAISVSADWAFYLAGVYNGECGWVIDHAVQLVGYGVERTIFGERPYWLVRNSWGAMWGERGYIKIHREADASKVVCGIDDDPQAGDGCDGGPKTVKVCGKCGILSDSSYPTGAKLLKN